MEQARETGKMEEKIINLINAALLPASAGGIVLRYKQEIPEIVVCKRRRGKVIELPKGGIEEGEGVKEAAIRETSEETGLKVLVIKELGTIPGTDTHWFVMRMTGGAFKNHDKEFDTVVWMPLREAVARLTDPDQKRILKNIGLRK